MQLYTSDSAFIICVTIQCLHYTLSSKDFCPSFGAMKDLRAFVLSCALMLATMASVTIRMRDGIIDQLDIHEADCCVVCESFNKANICFDLL